MRAFIAIELPQEIKDSITSILADLEPCGLDGRWVKPEHLHLTLKFLGSISAEQLHNVKAILEQCGRKHSRLQARLERFGFFPSERRPRVFFISTSGEAELRAIADDLEGELERCGFEKEGRFKSHITLCRLKSTKNIDDLQKRIATINPQGNFPVNEITLFESTLTPQGPIYEIIAKSALAP